jgi:hypothetical protein
VQLDFTARAKQAYSINAGLSVFTPLAVNAAKLGAVLAESEIYTILRGLFE